MIETASHVPSEKEKKYDRQLRLWAVHGQKALENSNLLLINSGSGVIGVESIKNLVLPGIGKFTIIDDEKVTEPDLGVNFFLDENDLGKSRAECCMGKLQELNPDVEGACYSNLDAVSFEILLMEQRFTFIIYTLPIRPELLVVIQRYTSKFSVPTICAHSAGFYFYFSVKYPATFPIVDTHPDAEATTDLRLLKPWKEPSEFSMSLTKNMEHQTAIEHGHIPYVALLLYYLEKWRKTRQGNPSTYKEKVEFRKFISQGARKNNAEGGEENFDEAIASVVKMIKEPSLPSSLKEIFDYQPNNQESKSSFWIITGAIKEFYETYDQLPLPGSVPDMKAESSVYVQLQSIYKAKARHDATKVFEIVRKNRHAQHVEFAEVENYCKNASFAKIISPTSCTNLGMISTAEFDNDEMSAIAMQPLSLLPIYLALNASSYLCTANSDKILSIIEKEVSGASFRERVQKISLEVARANGAELHNISAIGGGMVAQEVIKIITKQYIPVDNTCIFDGITSRTQVLRI